jgi:pilus assembly protein CpaC
MKVSQICAAWMIAIAASLSAQQPVSSSAQQTTPPSAQQTPPPPSAQQTPPSPSAQQTLPTPPSETSEEQIGAAPLRVRVNKSVLINTRDRLKRVSVTDPNVADAVVVSPTQVLVHGRSPGEVSLVLWDQAERSRAFDLRVDVDVTAAAEEMKRILADEPITVSASRSAIVLSGHVTSKEAAESAGLIAGAYSKNVVNVTTYGPVGSQEVLLEVHFAEVNRVALKQLGVNIFSTGAANMPGFITTGQFNQQQVIDVTGGIGKPVPGTTTNFPNLDILNVFLFRPDINLGVAIKALQQKNVLQVLAEPNLIALNGREASFLAGGEFPVPVVQSGVTANSITILFKEFGVRLRFKPTITPKGTIHLQVSPEVSALDFANGVRLSGFVVPSLITRRASTELELGDGQSFIIAGLMDNRVTNDMSKIPGIGDIPIIGNLFKSRNTNKTRTELMVFVTARLISPMEQKPALPNMPQKPIEPSGFDNGNKPSGGK